MRKISWSIKKLNFCWWLLISNIWFIPDLTCTHCSEVLPVTTEDLLEHCQTCEKMDRNDRTTRYTCIICPYSAYDRSKMRTHIRRHLGEKPFKCTFVGCDTTFVRWAEIKRHLKIKHKKETSKKTSNHF